jgi:hypothetical protein
VSLVRRLASSGCGCAVFCVIEICRVIVVSLYRCIVASLYRCTGNDFSLDGRRSRPASAAVHTPRGGDSTPATGTGSESPKKKVALARALRIRKVLRSLHRLHAALMEAGRKFKAAPALTSKL